MQGIVEGGKSMLNLPWETTFSYQGTLAEALGLKRLDASIKVGTLTRLAAGTRKSVGCPVAREIRASHPLSLAELAAS